MAYYSDMFCYGCDDQEVGITGFRSCLGAVYVGKRLLYAIHVPPTGSAPRAPRAFADLVSSFVEPKGKGKLLVFTNANERFGVEEEAKAIKRELGSPTTYLYRLTSYAGIAAVVRVRLEGEVVRIQSVSEHDAAIVNGGDRRVGTYDTVQGVNYVNPKIPSGAPAWSEIMGTAQKKRIYF
jgi:hypothetical protein